MDRSSAIVLFFALSFALGLLVMSWRQTAVAKSHPWLFRALLLAAIPALWIATLQIWPAAVWIVVYGYAAALLWRLGAFKAARTAS